MKNRRQKALFFDFDGVLADSVQIKTAAFRELFSSYGEETIAAVVEYHRQHGGISRVEKIKYAFDDVMQIPLSAEKHQELASQYSSIVTRKVIESDWISGAREFLDAMKGRIPLFVISGTPQEELQHVTRQRDMHHYFDEILGSPTRKPELVNGLLKKYDLLPQSSVFIGDAMTDYDAAIATGLHFIGIQGDIDFPEGTVVLPDCQGLSGALEQIFKDSFFKNNGS